MDGLLGSFAEIADGLVTLVGTALTLLRIIEGGARILALRDWTGSVTCLCVSSERLLIYMYI